MAYTGLSYMWGFAESEMDAHGKLVIPDYLGASLIALSSISALEYRDRTGLGQFIELAQVEAQGAIMGPAILDATVNGRQWEAAGYGEILGSGYAPYGAYPCKGDNEWVIIAVETKRRVARTGGGDGLAGMDTGPPLRNPFRPQPEQG